jgi:hypothetical protein
MLSEKYEAFSMTANRIEASFELKAAAGTKAAEHSLVANQRLSHGPASRLEKLS